MRVLITGGFGYLGGRIGEFLLKSGYDVLLGSRYIHQSPSWLLNAKVCLTNWDNQNSLESICRNIDVVVHTAGMNAKDCYNNQIDAFLFNTVATARLVKAAKDVGVKHFIYLSTAHVYNSPLAGNVSEQACPRNLHPYATSHLAGENVVLFVGENENLSCTVLRLSNAIGKPTHKNANCWNLLVNDLCRQAVEIQSLKLYSNGNQLRDFFSINELCRAIVWFIERNKEKKTVELFNFGSSTSISLKQMAELIQIRCIKVLGFTPNLSVNLESEVEPFYYDTKKLKNEGFLVHDDLTSELDSLLHFCEKEFK
jgi:UDP-glucose 4-epimerase